jgi:hypothetical protein
MDISRKRFKQLGQLRVIWVQLIKITYSKTKNISLNSINWNVLLILHP